MGFDSTFSGSLHPSKRLPDEVVRRIDCSDADLIVMQEGDDADGEPGDVVPAARFMHGYDVPHDVLKLQRALDEYGITLEGAIERVGDGGAYFERTEAKGGKVYVRTGEVVYGRARRVATDDLQLYAVEVYKEAGTGNELAGWLEAGPDGFSLRRKKAGERHGVKPPGDVAYFISRSAADEAASRFGMAGHRCSVVGWEETL